MTDQTTGILQRYGRFLWGGAALLLLLVLLGSFVPPGSSDGGSEADAQARAESLSGSFIEEGLKPDLLVGDIIGAASRHLTVLVQAVIRSDDRFTTVRIWRLDGALIYSTRPGGRHRRHRGRRSVDRAGVGRPDGERPLERRHVPRRSPATR